MLQGNIWPLSAPAYYISYDLIFLWYIRSGYISL
jgi:hypothetical protein